MKWLILILKSLENRSGSWKRPENLFLIENTNLGLTAENFYN